ncbi:uncharacterized protein [Aristolochia californica]|uniref:uncharacterized protein n=1 Tax=Aristolochia californica TaxID=171875 RepID=UPI0035E275A2
MSNFCHSISHRHTLPLPPISRVRLSNSSRIFGPAFLNFRSLESISKTPKKKWKVSCFVPREPSSSVNKSEFLENKAPEESIKPLLDQSKAESNCWVSNFQKAVNSFFRNHGEAWTVPWTVETVLQVMLLWIFSFWFVGSWIIPFLAHTAGFSKETLTYRGQALYSLLTDVAEGLAGIAILHRCLSRFRPLPANWFWVSLKGNWQLDVGLGCLLFPLVNRLSQFNINLLPTLPTSQVGASSVEQSIVARDPVAMILYAVVVSVCAPVWEEIIFRGFLLPSLTRYIPVWCSILVSAVAFALAHFNAQRMLPLVFLGVVMGAVFARSKNLFASILLHSLWNGFVFLDLMK